MSRLPFLSNHRRLSACLIGALLLHCGGPDGANSDADEDPASGGMGGSEFGDDTGGRDGASGGSAGGSSSGGAATGGDSSVSGGRGGAPLGGEGGGGSSCFNGERDGLETGIDCGGDCTPCVPAQSDVPFRAGRSSNLGLPSVSGWVLADLDGDGHQDVAMDATVMNAARGTGDGVFVHPEYVGDRLLGLELIGAADFDDDGNDDLLGCYGNNGAAVAFGSDTDPTLIGSTVPGYAYNPVGFVYGCAAADFDGDGLPDLAVGHGDDSGTLDILLNSGAGLTLTHSYTEQGSTNDLFLADVDGNDELDLVVSGPGVMRTWLSNGDGSFQNVIDTDLPDWARSVHVSREDGGRVLLFGDELGTATLAADGAIDDVEMISSEYHTSYAAGDLDGDGAAEVVAVRLSDYRMRIYRRADEGWEVWQEARPTRYPAHIEVVDVNGDGLLDIAFTSSSASLDVFLNEGQGSFPFSPVLAQDDNPIDSVAWGDLSGDGRPDIAIGYGGGPSASGYVETFITASDGLPEPVELLSVERPATSLVIGPSSGTAHADLLALGNGTLTSWEGDGTGHLSEGPSQEMLGTGKMVLRDVGGDDVTELVIASSSIDVYERAAGGFFAFPAVYTAPEEYSFLRTVADVDGDDIDDLVVGPGFDWIPASGGNAFGEAQSVDHLGADDVLVVDPSATERRWLLSYYEGLVDLHEDADGVTETILGGEDSQYLIFADWNRDGIEDVLASGTVVTLYEGHDDGSFSHSGISLSSGGFSRGIAFFDATGDGLKDIVVATSYDGITILEAKP